MPSTIEVEGTEESDSDDLDSLASVVTLDDVLHYLGEFGVYQRLVSIMLMPFGFFNVFVYFGQMFMTLVPEEHWCKLPDVVGISREDMRLLVIPKIEEVPNEGHELPFSRCWMYDVPVSTLLQSNQTTNTAWPKKRCKNWEFEFTDADVPYATVATELEWVCEKRYLVNLAQSIFFVGSIFGGFLFGWMADEYGRIPVLVVTNMFGFLAGLSTVFTKGFWHFGICRFLVGFASDNNFTMMYILVLEYVGPKWRTWVANIAIAICFPIACCSLPWIAFYLSNWKTFAICTSAPLAFAAVTPFMVPESVRWLASRGKIDEAIKIMKRIERVNKRSVPETMYDDFKEDSENITNIIRREQSRVKDLFNTPRLRKFTILLIAIWGIIAMVFDGHIRNMGTLGLNIFFTFTISSASTFPADILVALSLDYWGRRWLSFTSMFLSGLACFMATLTSGVYFTVFGLIGRFLIHISYNIGLQYAAELLPTVVRAKGVALIHIFGYATAILSPFIAYMSIINRQTPMIVLGLLSTIGGVMCLFLPETLNQELSQTLQEGEEFGINQRFFDMPCLEQKDFEPTPNKHHLHAQRPVIRGEVLRSSIISGALGSKHRLSVWSERIDGEGTGSISVRSNRGTLNSSKTSSIASSSRINRYV